MSIPRCPIRLNGISGYNERINEIIYCWPRKTNTLNSVVVFFGGDVQDYTENMNSHRDNKNYVKWNLDNTAHNLQKKFPESHIVVVKPSRMDYKTFSCFENFVPSSKCGAPEHTPMHNALQHLEKLLYNISTKLVNMKIDELKKAEEISQAALTFDCTEKNDGEITWNKKNLNLNKYNISLIGFSKGCVVLNQFLYEFHYFQTLKPDDEMQNFVGNIKDMFWLDGGHSGGKNTWITSRSLLDTFTRLGIRIHVHVTPYQIQDERRPWIRKEEKQFSDTLKKLGACIDRKVYFEDVLPSLLLHFDVLNVFRDQSEDI